MQNGPLSLPVSAHSPNVCDQQFCIQKMWTTWATHYFLYKVSVADSEFNIDLDQTREFMNSWLGPVTYWQLFSCIFHFQSHNPLNYFQTFNEFYNKFSNCDSFY